jgi:hypothetical protein
MVARRNEKFCKRINERRHVVGKEINRMDPEETMSDFLKGFQRNKYVVGAFNGGGCGARLEFGSMLCKRDDVSSL